VNPVAFEGWIRLAFVRGFKAANESPGMDEYIRDRCDEFVAAIPNEVLDRAAPTTRTKEG
jgi:hypothetical protein